MLTITKPPLPAGLKDVASCDKEATSSDPWQFFLRLNKILIADGTPEAMMNDVLTALCAVAEIEACWIGQPDPSGKVRLQVSSGKFPEEPADYRRSVNVLKGPHRNGLSGVAWRSGQPEVIDDWKADAKVADCQKDTSHLNWRSAVAVALPGQAGPHGLLTIYSNSKGFFPDIWSSEVVTQLAALIGNALENRQKQAALNRTRALYRTLFHGAELLLKARAETPMLRAVCRHLVDSGLFVSAAVGRVEADGFLHYKASFAHTLASTMRNSRFEYTAGQKNGPVALLCWDKSKTVTVNSYHSDKRLISMHEIAKEMGIRSISATPIFRGGARWAVMTVTAGEENAFDDELINLLNQLGSMIGHRLEGLDAKAALRAERETQSRIARQDALTLLPNRLAFQEHLEAAMARALRHRNAVGVGVIDLDDFKQVNDNWGHAAGDTVLRVVAGRMRRILRGGDFAARLGGDEFALVLKDWQGNKNIEGFCQRLHDAINAPIALPNGETVHMSLSAGFTVFPPDDATADMLIRHADMALFAAKAEKGKPGRFWRQYQDINKRGEELLRNQALLRADALEVHYQPVINLQTGKIVSVEALARLRDGGNLIYPAAFLEDLLLDDRNLLFQQVLETGLRQLSAWDAAGAELVLSVNVDAQILLLDRTLPYMLAQIERFGIEPARLVLEILETHDFHDMKTAKARLALVRQTGIRIALDDVGAGYSSILKIRDLPIDVVKLDRAFAGSLRERPDDLMFISALQSLSASLGMSMVVEGVESGDVIDALQVLGTEYMQGYIIAKPKPAAQITDWLLAFNPIETGSKPKTLLGAYALHLMWSRATQIEGAGGGVLSYLRHMNPFSLESFFAQSPWRRTPMHDAYEELQALLRYDSADRQLIETASQRFRNKMKAALSAQG
jgi:diguanylate cyclase (GGDEF)-like protein